MEADVDDWEDNTVLLYSNKYTTNIISLCHKVLYDKTEKKIKSSSSFWSYYQSYWLKYWLYAVLSKGQKP